MSAPIFPVEQTELPASALDERGDYPHGSKPTKYLRPDWTLPHVLGLVRASNEPLVGLPLRALGADTWMVLKRLMGADAAAVPDALLDMEEGLAYVDVFTDRQAYAAFPLYVLTRDTDQYAQPSRGVTAERLAAIACTGEELTARLSALDQDADWEVRVKVDRVTQVLMGTGFMTEYLPADGSVILDWQFAEFSNGDILILAGYEWFNN